MIIVGDTKKVKIGDNKYTVRLSNKSTSSNCSSETYSQTACGFVIEFAEIVEKRAMNSGNTNVGGWPGSELYMYVQGDFYNSLPDDLKSVITTTRVISGYGNNGVDTGNFVSYDKMYLLSGVEVFGSDSRDTAASTTTQLEYYRGMEVDAKISWGGDAYSRTYKRYQGNDGSTELWWLRPALSGNFNAFRCILYGGLNADVSTHWGYGLAPAFRIE